MIDHDVAIVLQARMGSTRLPGKALAPIGTRSLVARCLTRLKGSGAGAVVLATTVQPEDDELVAEAQRFAVRVYRGHADDVLGRFAAVTAALAVPLIVRATGDNPAVDPDSVTRLVAAVRREDADHAVEANLPSGCTVEVVKAEALLAAAALAVDAEDREHVTPFIRRNRSGFRCVTTPAPGKLARPDLRFTVDTPSDLAYMRRIFAAAGGGEPTLANLIAVADRLGPREEAA